MTRFTKLLYGLLAAIPFFLIGCASTSTLYSNTFVKPTSQISKINVLYIENSLRSKGAKSAYEFYDIGYTDLPELFRERVPIVLGLNNIHAEYATFKRSDFGLAREEESIKWANSVPGTMILSLQVIGGNVMSSSSMPRATTLNFQANLIDPKTKLRQWTGQFEIRFVEPPVGKNGFDNASVDNLLKNVLEQLAKDKIVTLANNQVVIPSSQTAQSKE
ncbi:MAG: hypothetical protein ACYC2R_16360 [Burkholderiales bacterium]